MLVDDSSMELSRIYGFYCERIALLFVDDVVISECVEFVCPVELRSEVEVYGRGDVRTMTRLDLAGMICIASRWTNLGGAKNRPTLSSRSRRHP